MAERCFIHPDRKSSAPCHSCGRYFCEECLTEGEEYYYCREEHCQTLKAQETDRLRVAKELESNLIKQKWKENTRRFYSIISTILFVVWVLLTGILLFTVVYDKWGFSWPHILLPPAISLIVCIKLFILVWLIRIIFYKPFWESRISPELKAGQ